jgi:hypothetical protein
MAMEREPLKLERGPLMAVCRCTSCGEKFETPEPPEIICPCCKLAALKLHAATKDMQNGNMPPMVSRVLRGTSGSAHRGVRPRVLGDA